MKKHLILGTFLVLMATLMFSCNKNRFDFQRLETIKIEDQGQLKIPVGSLDITLQQIMKQFAYNNLISFDEQGNLQFHISYQDEKLKNLFNANDLLNIGSKDYSQEVEFKDPFQMYAGIKDTTIVLTYDVALPTDTVILEKVVIKTGKLIWTIRANFGNADIVFSSPDIYMPNGDTLHSTANELDLTGATFRLRDPVTNTVDSILTLRCVVHVLNTGQHLPKYRVEAICNLNDLDIQEVTGRIYSYTYEIPSFDTLFSLPIDNIDGELTLHGVKPEINVKNTFGGLKAKLEIDQAELYERGTTNSSPIFQNYPHSLTVLPSPTYSNIMQDETLDLNLSSNYNAVRFSGRAIINPDGVNQLISVYDTSSVGLTLGATIPMSFSAPKVKYQNAIDLEQFNLDALKDEYIDAIEEVLLTIIFDSRLPFNLEAEIYTFDSQMGVITDTLLVNPLQIAKYSYGAPARTETMVSLTQKRLNHLIHADKLLLTVELDTGGQNVTLNSSHGLTATIKTDVKYYIDKEYQIDSLANIF